MRKIRKIKQTPGQSLEFEAQRVLSFYDIPERFSDFPVLLQELGNAGLLYRACMSRNLNLNEVFQKLKDDQPSSVNATK